MKAKDGILHIRIEKPLREKAAKKAARSKKTLTQYVCDLIAADTQRTKSPARVGSKPGAVGTPRTTVPGDNPVRETR